MLRLALVLALLAPQDDDLHALVRRLGDDDPAKRDRAAQALEARGNASIEALLQALDDPDLEVRSRASALIERLDPSYFLASHVVGQRERKLRLIAGPHPYEDDKAYTDGAEFLFERSRWFEGGKTPGSVIRTRGAFHLDGEIEWSLVSVRSSRELRVETCSIHSPGIVYLPGPNPESCTMRIKGVRRWLCDVPVRFRDPKEGDRRRIGKFTLTLKWPHIVLRCDDPLPLQVVTRMLQQRDVGVQTPESRRQPAPEIAQPTDEPAIFFPEAVETPERNKPVWCGCNDQPARQDLPPTTSQKHWVRIDPNGRRKLREISEVSLTLHVPVEESFELTSPPLDY